MIVMHLETLGPKSVSAVSISPPIFPNFTGQVWVWFERWHLNDRPKALATTRFFQARRPTHPSSTSSATRREGPR